MDILMSLLPLAIVIVGFIGLELGGRVVAPVSLILTVLIAGLYFKSDWSAIVSKGWAGIVSGAKLMYMLWAALIIVKILIGTGAIVKLRELAAIVTDDKRKMVVLISWGFGSFIEGVSAAGSPGVICIPLLVGLGVNPMAAIAATLICNGIPTSWGGIGLSCSGGFGAITAEAYPWAAGLDVLNSISISAARISFFGALIVPVLIIMICFGPKAMKGMWKTCTVSGVAAAAAILFVTHVIGFEFTDIIYGLFSMFCTGLFIVLERKAGKVTTPEEYRIDTSSMERSDMPAWKAIFMYVLVIIFLPIARFTLPGTWLYAQGFAVWIGTTLLVVDVIGMIILGCVKDTPKYLWQAIKGIINAAIAICCLNALAEVMKVSGMLTILADVVAGLVGNFYPAAAVVIGTMGSFVTGTGLGSNAMFHGMHISAAQSLGCNLFATLGGQSVGGAIGNMLCANNVCAGEAAAEMSNREGEIMRITVRAGLILMACYAVIAMLNANIFFADFSGISA